jgi:hypothetical protein
MTAGDRFETALRCSDPPQALRALAQELAREGLTKAQVYQLFESFLVQLRKRADFRESDEEIVLDIMDALTVWCHPSAELLPGGQ